MSLESGAMFCCSCVYIKSVWPGMYLGERKDLDELKRLEGRV